MTNTSLVSIVTPAYNAADFIDHTLKSVQRQTYSNLEHIVIDDGSIDNTAAILKKYEGVYNLKWFSKLNEGQAITVNKAFKMAKGDIIAWLNADDVLFSTNVINDVVEAFRRRDVDVVYGHMAVIDERNKMLKIQYAPSKLDFDILLLDHFAACVFYRRDVVSKYCLNLTNTYALDYEQCLRMAKGGIKFGYIDEPLIAWRKHHLAKSISGNRKLQAETKALRKEYDIKLGLKHYWMKLAYYALLMTRKIYGAKEIVELYANPEQFQLAFDIHFDPLFKLVMRQTVPYR